MNNLKKILKENIKVITIMLFVIICTFLGVTYALKIGPFSSRVDINSANISVNITYDSESNNASITNNGKLMPIADSLVTGEDVLDERVLKAKFKVSGDNNNPENTIYDVVLRDANIDCNLRTEEVKWRLYKNSILLSEGNLSPSFDTMEGNRLVLTNTQEDLTTTEDSYTFLLWISESCTGDLSQCTLNQDQSKYLNKTLSGSIKIETSTKGKKAIARKTAPEESCSYTAVSAPTCIGNTVYNGSPQTLVNESTGYTLTNNVGTNAGSYNVTVTLSEGYKWEDGTVEKRLLACSLDKKDLTLTAKDQTITYSKQISSNVSDITASGLIAGDTIESISLTSPYNKIGNDVINISNAKIVNTSGDEVTDNYNITYNKGTVVVNCSRTAEEPIVNNRVYTGLLQVGVSEGKNITLSGETSAVKVGDYVAIAKPKANYCWSDGSNSEKTYNWSISNKTIVVNLENKVATYTGSPITIDEATIEGIIEEIPNEYIKYNYYNGSSCQGSKLEDVPTNAGSYSVKAIVEANGNYEQTESNCASLTIEKAQSSCTISDIPTLEYPNSPTGSVTYSCIGDGTVTVSSSDSSILDVAFSDENANLTANDVGNVTLTASISEGKNYYSSSTSKNTTINGSEYTVTYDANGGTGTMSIDKINYGNNYITKDNTFTYTGYTFAGWNEKADGTGTNWTSYIDKPWKWTHKKNVTLYAQWQVNTVSIKYNVNGGTIATSSNDSGTWTTDSNEIILKNGDYEIEQINYGGSLNSSGLSDYNNANYINIAKTGYTAVSGSEWKCLSGCSTSGKLFDQSTVYNASDFCDASNGDCEVVIGVNWKPNSQTLTIRHVYFYLNSIWKIYQIETVSTTYDSSYTPANVTPPTGYYACNKYNYYDSSSNAIQTGKDIGTAFTVTDDNIVHVLYYPNKYTLTVNPNGGTYNGTTSNSTFSQYYETSKNMVNPTAPAGYKVTFNGNGGTASSSSLTSTKNFTGWTKSGSGQYVTRSSLSSVSSEITHTVKNDSNGVYDNFSYSVSGLTSDTYYKFTYPGYTYTSGDNYEILWRLRLNSLIGVGLGFRHAVIANDWGTTGRVSLDFFPADVSNYSSFKYVTMEKTISGSTFTQGGISYDAWPHFELYTRDLINSTSSANFDILDMLVIDRTKDQLLQSNANSYWFKNGSGTLTANYSNGSITLPSATRTGYTFNGWYDAASGGNKIGNAGDSYTPTAAKTLYAQWTVNTQITFTLSNSAGLSKSTTITTESTARITEGSSWMSVAPTISWNITSSDSSISMEIYYNPADNYSSTVAASTLLKTVTEKSGSLVINSGGHRQLVFKVTVDGVARTITVNFAYDPPPTISIPTCYATAGSDCTITVKDTRSITQVTSAYAHPDLGIPSTCQSKVDSGTMCVTSNSSSPNATNKTIYQSSPNSTYTQLWVCAKDATSTICKYRNLSNQSETTYTQKKAGS